MNLVSTTTLLTRQVVVIFYLRMPAYAHLTAYPNVGMICFRKVCAYSARVLPANCSVASHPEAKAASVGIFSRVSPGPPTRPAVCRC